MTLPKNLIEYESGRVRSRTGLNTKMKSHRVFKNWTYGPNGERSAPKSVTHKFARFNADLTSTYYNNPARGTQTVHGLGFDIDLSRTSRKWIDEKGRVSWQKIGSFLALNEAPILSFFTSVAASTSGKGLGLYLAISPLEIVPSTALAQKSAKALQAHVITILNYHGIGADPGAMGLVRDIPNFFNPNKQIDSDLIGTDRQVDNKRYPVVAGLLKYTNRHPAIRRLKSHDPKRLFSGHRTSEKKLALLYEYLRDEALEGSIWVSGAELLELTGLSKSTLYNFLSSRHEWLDIINYGKVEGYELVFKPTAAHTERCYELLNNYDLESDERGLVDNFTSLESPEFIKDGERNDYLTRAIIELKVKGVQYHDALAVMAAIAKRIPDASTSRNCKNIASLVKSIYYHRIETFGTNLNPVSLVLRQELEATSSKALIEFPKKSKKGTTVGSIQSVSSGSCSKAPVQDQVFHPVSEREEKNYIFPIGEGGSPGDLPQHFGTDARVISEDSGFDISIGDQNDIFPEKIDAVDSPPETFFQLSKPKVFKTLKELRRQNYGSIDPLDRFEKAFHRCLKRRSENEIISALKKEVPTMIQLGTRYVAPNGPYRRVLASFSKLSVRVRAELLKGL